MAVTPTIPVAPPARIFRLVGGDLCLDFTNTVGGKRGAVTREFLNNYTDLLSWFEQAKLVAETDAKKLARLADRDPAEAAAVLARAIELREAIYRIFATLIERRNPSRADLDRLNSELAVALCRMRVTPNNDGSGFAWSWTSAEDLGAPLGPVARAAADLLTHGHVVERVQRCCGDNCGWLFLDSSKNHSRRWCDMRDCGNLAKVRRHRARERKTSN